MTKEKMAESSRDKIEARTVEGRRESAMWPRWFLKFWCVFFCWIICAAHDTLSGRAKSTRYLVRYFAPGIGLMHSITLCCLQYANSPASSPRAIISSWRSLQLYRYNPHSRTYKERLHTHPRFSFADSISASFNQHTILVVFSTIRVHCL